MLNMSNVALPFHNILAKVGLGLSLEAYEPKCSFTLPEKT
jgi:hypothetical protein